MTGGRRIAALAAVLVGVLALAAVAVVASGVLDMAESDTAQESRFLVAGDLALTVPGSWQPSRDEGTLARLGLDDAVALAPGGDGERAGLLLGQDRTPANGLVSEPLAELLGAAGTGEAGTGAPTAVRLPAGEALRHDSAAGRPAPAPRTVAYLLPTDRGVATAVCYARTAEAAGSVKTCTDMLATLAVAGARPQSVTPDPELQRALTTGIQDLNARRARGADELRAKRTPAGQASAARRLGRAHDEIATTLDGASAPPLAEPARDALVEAIGAVGDGYRALARGAGANDRAAYAAGRRRVREAEAQVNAGLRDLRLLGYGVASDVAS
jgi:hypothetical protein